METEELRRMLNSILSNQEAIYGLLTGLSKRKESKPEPAPVKPVEEPQEPPKEEEYGVIDLARVQADRAKPDALAELVEKQKANKEYAEVEL